MNSFMTSENKEAPTKKRKRKDKKSSQEKTKKEDVEELPSTQEELEEINQALVTALLSSPDPTLEKPRIIGLFGNIDEEMAGEVISSMVLLKSSGKIETIALGEEDFPEYKPFQLWISTWGGTAMDMFAIYDTMRLIGEDCDIHTVALGKVMSAGVLLLAAGTKGKRKIGKNCRIMLHSVIGGHSGTLHNLENEMEEIRWIQDQHIKCLVEETHMSEKYLKKLLSRKVNVYLNAEEAVELGIADEII